MFGIMLTGHLYIFFGRVSVQLFYLFSTWVSFVVLLLKSKSSLYVQDISVLPDIYSENTFSSVYFFIFLTVSYQDQKISIMVKLNFSIFSSHFMLFVFLRNLYANTRSQRFSYIFPLTI